MENSNKEKLLGEQLSCIWKKYLDPKKAIFSSSDLLQVQNINWYDGKAALQLLEKVVILNQWATGSSGRGTGIPEQDRSICSDFCKQIMHKHLLVKRAGKKSQQTDVHEAWEHCCKAAVLQESQALINLVLDCIGWKHSGHTPLKTWVE